MLDLAIHGSSGPVSLAEIAQRQEISLSYMEQLFARLRRNGLVKSARGPGGGYKLGQVSSKLFIADIITAVDEPIDVRKCNGDGSCKNGSKCLTHTLWSNLSIQIYDFLGGISLEELVSSRDIQKIACEEKNKYG